MKWIYSLLLFLCFESCARIAIFSYGSLVKQPIHSVTGAQLHACKFNPTVIRFPISIAILKNTNRITALIDNKGSLKRIWSADSHYETMDQAMQDLAAREGAAYLSDEKKYDTQYISYVRQLAPNEIKKADEDYVEALEKWVVKQAGGPRQELSKIAIGEIAHWAVNNNVNTVLWVSCPIDARSKKEFIEELLRNDELLKNAQRYIKRLPDGAQTDLEKAILRGKQFLYKSKDIL